MADPAAHTEVTGEPVHHAEPTAFGLDATVWVALAMVVVLAILFWKKVPGAIGKSLDAKIAAIAQRFASAPASLALVGFSDSQGPAELNRSLSLRRAAAVRIALLDAGVDPAAVTSVTGLGEDAPPVDSGDDTDEAGNRVVLIYGR